MTDWPRVALLTIGDGRDDLLADTRDSLAYALGRDPGDLLGAFAEHVHVDDRAHRLGFGGAIRQGWARLRDLGRSIDYVFHLEEDWRFDRAINLDHLAAALAANPPLAQMALRRHAVNAYEERAGGVVECWPDEYEERRALVPPGRWLAYLEHGLYFTTNPSLYHRTLIERGDWPEGRGSEAAYTQQLLARGRRFALWGSRAGGPWITHTGTIRTGGGY